MIKAVNYGSVQKYYPMHQLTLPENERGYYEIQFPDADVQKDYHNKGQKQEFRGTRSVVESTPGDQRFFLLGKCVKGWNLTDTEGQAVPFKNGSEPQTWASIAMIPGRDQEELIAKLTDNVRFMRLLAEDLYERHGIRVETD